MNATPFPSTPTAIDVWLSSLGSICWAQEQSEAVVNSLVEHGQVARDDALQFTNKMADLAKANQAELQKFIHHSVALSLDGLQRVHQAQLAGMQSRLDEMAERLAQMPHRA